ncbi:MAG: hypothetical protein J6C27_00940 [Clostridia bacterium]|nr:hypothetical protein [Clostridia bacterium]
MSDRDKLIGLIDNFTENITARDLHSSRFASEFAEHLLENGVMCPPCKVGDMVWWVAKLIDKNCEGKLNIEIGKVDSFLIRSDGLWAHCCYESGLAYRHLVAANFGKTIFLTKEEAEAKLKELKEIDA